MKDNKKEIQRLQKYADQLVQRIQDPVPEKHKHREESFRQMLNIDLRKTKAKIAKL